MSDNKNINIAPETGKLDPVDANIASSEVSSVVGSVKTAKVSYLRSANTRLRHTVQYVVTRYVDVVLRDYLTRPATKCIIYF